MSKAGESAAAVSARDLSVAYYSGHSTSRFLALNGLSFDIGRGEVLGMVGEAGAGKSTLAMAVAARLVPGGGDGVPRICGGTLDVLGTPVRGIGNRRADRLTLRVGYLPQDGIRRLKPHLSIAENIAEPIYARDRHFDQGEAARAVSALIDQVQLPRTALVKLPHELSSGQLQRVALARALVLDPWLLVADEPLRGVDVGARAVLMDVIHEFQRRRPFSALVVSSDLAAISTAADRIAVLYQGRIIGIGSMDELLADPDHPYLKGLALARDHGLGTV